MEREKTRKQRTPEILDQLTLVFSSSSSSSALFASLRLHLRCSPGLHQPRPLRLPEQIRGHAALTRQFIL